MNQWGYAACGISLSVIRARGSKEKPRRRMDEPEGQRGFVECGELFDVDPARGSKEKPRSRRQRGFSVATAQTKMPMGGLEPPTFGL
jgi:hypothetical protein